MVAAVLIMQRHRTTVIPHLEAAQLVTTGVFKWTRNPIYLGDAMVLAGLILRWDAVLALPLVPLFVWIIEKRFILPEERRLRRKFTAQFGRYYTTTRRWI
jgi:protein-S-isoprenylcysteine O-methyltransferase Ste14